MVALVVVIVIVVVLLAIVFGAWLLSGPGSDRRPPARIADLATQNPTTDSIELRWTAPGDDGNVGTAATYDIRYSSSAIDNEGGFNTATHIASPPVPAVAGTVQTVNVSGLSSGTRYYFAIKTADEVPNWSTLSNSPDRTTLSPKPVITFTSPNLGGSLTNLTAMWMCAGTSAPISPFSIFKGQITQDGFPLAAFPQDLVVYTRIAFGPAVRLVVYDPNGDGDLTAGDSFHVYGMESGHAFRFSLIWATDSSEVASVSWTI